MLKKSLSASLIGRHSPGMWTVLLPRGEALARNVDSSPPRWGGTRQKYGQFSSPMGRHLPEIWTVLLPGGRKAIPTGLKRIRSWLQTRGKRQRMRTSRQKPQLAEAAIGSSRNRQNFINLIISTTAMRSITSPAIIRWPKRALGFSERRFLKSRKVSCLSPRLRTWKNHQSWRME